MTFDDDFFHLFDELARPISSEAKAIDNQEDELLKLVDDAMNNIEANVRGIHHN